MRNLLVPALAAAVGCVSAARAETHVLAHVRPGVAISDVQALTVRGALLERVGVTGASPLFRTPPARTDAGARLLRWTRLDVRSGLDVRSCVAALERFDALFDRVELDGAVQLGADQGVPRLPNDPKFDLQYGLHNTGQVISSSVGVPDADCDAPEAWEAGSGGPVVVAVIDAGVNPHVEIADRLLVGWNVMLQNNNTSATCSSHGTHVAGIIAAERDNGVGIAGMADLVLILPVKTFDSSCSSEWSIIAEGLVWAVDHGVRIANMSIHGYDYAAVMEDAVNYAYDSGVLVVAIAGNDADEVGYPGKYENAMAIAATTNQDVKSSFSNEGPEVDVAAAGSAVYSLISLDQYGYKSGTSMAAPLVAGLAALLLGTDPWMTPGALWSVIVDTADDIESPGFDVKTGWGRINAASAMALVATRIAGGDINADGVVDASDLALVLGAWGQSGLTDLDGDGTTGGSDLAVVLGGWTG